MQRWDYHLQLVAEHLGAKEAHLEMKCGGHAVALQRPFVAFAIQALEPGNPVK